MKIEVWVKPGTKKTSVEPGNDGPWIVRVTAPAIEGKANEAVIEALASHFNKPKSCVVIIRGHKGRRKIVEIA